MKQSKILAINNILNVSKRDVYQFDITFVIVLGILLINIISMFFY